MRQRMIIDCRLAITLILWGEALTASPSTILSHPHVYDFLAETEPLAMVWLRTVSYVFLLSYFGEVLIPESPFGPCVHKKTNGSSVEIRIYFGHRVAEEANDV